MTCVGWLQKTQAGGFWPLRSRLDISLRTVMRENCVVEGIIGIAAGLLLGFQARRCSFGVKRRRQAMQEGVVWTTVLCLWCIAGGPQSL